MKKFISLVLSVLILCSVFVGVGTIANAAYEPVEVTLVSQQGAFENITETYAKGEVFEMTIIWQSNNILINSQAYTYLNNKGLRVISQQVNKDKIKSGTMNNISEELQERDGEVIFSFSTVNGCDYSTADYMVTYQIKVLDTASPQETLTLNFREAFGSDKDDLSQNIRYISNSTINEETKDDFALSAVLSKPAEIPTNPTTEPSTNPSSETESSSQSESTTETESTSDTTDTSATDPSETANNTSDTTATEPASSDNTQPTTPSESTAPSESTDPTEEHSHQWDVGTIIKDATCTETGEIKSICTECGAFKFDIIEATGHKEVTVNAKKATYFEKGYTGDKVCETCHETLEKGKVIKILKLKKPTVSYKAGKKKFTVKYTKVADAKGFEVRYKLGKKSYTETFKAKKNVSKTINKLKKGSYKVQVRAYTKKGKAIAYSKWTKKTTVKVK